MKSGNIFLIVLFILLIGSCTENEGEVSSLNNEIIGHYCGWQETSDGSGVTANFDIFLSPDDETKIIINYFWGTPDRIGEVQASVEGNKLEIYPQTFYTSYYPGGNSGGWVDTVLVYDTISVNGLGSFNPENGLLTIDYSVERTYTGEVINTRIEANNYIKYKASGKYYGNNENEVIIENVSDSLNLSINCTYNQKKYFWENVSGYDKGCGIYIHKQEVVEIHSGKLQTITGGGNKDENSISMWIDIHHGIGASRIGNFIITKND